MFGTVARLTVKPGMEGEFAALGDTWSREHGHDAGEVASYVFHVEGQPQEYILVAIFKDRDTYYKNAADPETDRRYRQMRALLEADPVWSDGEIVHSQALSGT